MSGFTFLPEPEADEIDLELASLGRPTTAREEAALDAARAGPLRRAQDALEEERRAFVPRPLPGRAPSARRWPWVAGALALAAVAVLVVQLAPVRDEVRPMGGWPVDLAVRRGSGTVAPGHFLAGDLVFVRSTAPGDGVIEVWTVQDDGAVSVLDPGHAVRAHEAYALDGGARLDDHGGREWLVVTFEPAVRAPSAIEGEARSLLPDPLGAAGPERYVVEITRGR